MTNTTKPALSASPVGEPLRRIVLDTLNAVAPAVENLSVHQEQCDRDGVMVKVSRQALDEVLNAVNEVAMQSAITTSPASPVAQEPVATKATQQASADFLHEEMIKLGSPLTYTACLTLTKRITDTNTLAWAGEVNKLCTEIGSLKNEIAALKSAAVPPATPVAQEPVAYVPVETWKCAARKQSLPEPADCGWPTCGCDPYADKVIAALEEQGHAQEPEAWQWRYVGETEWKTPTGGRKLTDEEIKRERRQIEQRPLHYLEQTSSILGQRAADAINDALGGWMYIRRNHGDLYGVGWDRVEAKLKAVLAEDLIARNIPVPDYLYPRSIPSEKPAVAETHADAPGNAGLLSGVSADPINSGGPS